FGQRGRALVLSGDGADLDLDDPAVFVALDLLQLRTGKAGRDALDVEQHLPRVGNRGAHSEAVCDLHAFSSAIRSAGVSTSVGSPVPSHGTSTAPWRRKSTRAPSSPSNASASSQ